MGNRAWDWAVVLTLSTGAFYLVGFMEESSYYASLGIPDGGLRLPLEHYMASSIFVLPFLVLLGLVAVAAWEISKRGLKHAMPWPFAVATVLAVAFVVTFSLRTGSDVRWMAAPPAYWIGTATVFLLVAAGGYFWKKPQPLSKTLLGGLSLACAMMLILTSSFMGMARAADMKSDCAHRSFVNFDPPIRALGNDAYWVVGQDGSQMWLRSTNATLEFEATFVELPVGTIARLHRGCSAQGFRQTSS